MTYREAYQEIERERRQLWRDVYIEAFRAKAAGSPCMQYLDPEVAACNVSRGYGERSHAHLNLSRDFYDPEP